MAAEVNSEWTDADDNGLVATKRISKGKVEMRCSKCKSDMEYVRGPRGDGQTRHTRYKCTNDGCDGKGKFTHVRTQSPRTVVSYDVEWRVTAEPWDLSREVPTPLQCDFCGFEGSPPEEKYKYNEHGYEPAEGYETVFEVATPPEHLTEDHDSKTFLQCPRCTRYSTQHSFKSEFKRDRDPDEYVDEEHVSKYAERDGEHIRSLDRVRWKGRGGDLYVVLTKTFHKSKYTEYEQPDADYKLVKFSEMQSCRCGFPSIYAASGPKNLMYYAIQRSVPIYAAKKEDLEFVHRGPLTVSRPHEQHSGGRAR